MAVMKKLMLTLILGMIMSWPAVSISKNFLGFGATAYAGDDQDENEDYNGDIFIPPPGCCIQ